MSLKPRPRSIAEQREQLDRVIAAKLPGQTFERPRTKLTGAPKRTQSSRPS
jgi:hypothetical protein